MIMIITCHYMSHCLHLPVHVFRSCNLILPFRSDRTGCLPVYGSLAANRGTCTCSPQLLREKNRKDEALLQDSLSAGNLDYTLESTPAAPGTCAARPRREPSEPLLCSSGVGKSNLTCLTGWLRRNELTSWSPGSDSTQASVPTDATNPHLHP